MTARSFAPFSASYTREAPDILGQLDCTLVLSTFQAGKVIFLSPNGEKLTQLARNFQRPMGMAVDESRMAVATQQEVVVLENARQFAASYPNKPDHYDALFVPRSVHFTGPVDLHDMYWKGDELYAVSPLLSCIVRVGGISSVEPKWRPPFISALEPEDRCHLNGMALNGDDPAYVTALSATDHAMGWRNSREASGVLLDMKSGETILSGLSLPHSPRLYDHQLYFLNSGKGELLLADTGAGTSEVVNRVPGFARGLARQGDYLFVGHSKVREKHQFGSLPVSRSRCVAGVTIVHLPSGRIAGGIHYQSACEEIYDVQVLSGLRRPGILGLESDFYREIISTPGAGYWRSAPPAASTAAEKLTDDE